MNEAKTEPTQILTVEVVYSSSREASLQSVRLAEGSTLREAIERSKMLERFPEIDLKVNKVGVFGNIVKLDSPVKQGDRVEIYRPITCDPETVPRRDLQEEAADTAPAERT